MSYQNNSRQMVTPVGSRKRKDKETKPPVQHPQSGEPASSKRILAGYLAFEYLTKGSLFGEKFDPARAVAEPNRSKPVEESSKANAKHDSYAEVASILKNGEAHIPEVVNPSQLARWIKM